MIFIFFALRLIFASHGLAAVATAARGSKRACSIQNMHCDHEELDDTFVALQLQKVVKPGVERKTEATGPVLNAPAIVATVNSLIPSVGADLLPKDTHTLIPKVPDPFDTGKAWKGLRLLDAGASRTGTESVVQALKMLGYTVSHSERFKMPWTPEGKALSKLLDGEDSSPYFGFLKQGNIEVLADGGPKTVQRLLPILVKDNDSKILLTLHPHGAKGWIRSVAKFSRWWPIGSQYPAPKKFEFLPGCVVPVGPNLAISDELHQQCEKAYEDYNNAIISAVPKDRLLVYTVTSGWSPLCKFLGKPVPTNYEDPVAFPWIDNVREKIYKLKSQGLEGFDWINGHLPQASDVELVPQGYE